MPVIELPGTPSGYAVGSQAGNYLAKSADAAANFACSLYKAYPGAVIGNPAYSALRGLYDSLCSGRPSGLPAPPSSPFNGGQCNCVGYYVSYSITNSAGTNTFQAYLVGKIGGILKEPNNNVNAPWRYSITYYPCSGGQPTGQVGKLGIYTGGAQDNVIITGVSRADGQADNCGNPPVQYPNVIPPSGYTNGTGNITYNDGASLTVPLVFAPIVTDVELNPRFNVDVGGIKLQFDLGGVKFDLGNGNSDPALPPDRFNDQADNYGRLSGQIQDVRNVENDILDKINTGGGNTTPPPPPAATPPDSDPNLEPDQKQPDDPKNESGVTKLKWVKIVLTKLPDKVQFGDGAPNCYFAGWFEFKSGASCYSREQVNFQTSLFLAPPGADGYAYTLTNGAEGYAVVYRSKD